MSFKKRLLICFTVVALIPTLILSCWLTIRNAQATVDQYIETSRQLLESRQMSLTLFTDTARSNILELLSTPQLISLLGGISSNHGVQDVESEYELVETRIRFLQSMGNSMFENIGVYSPTIGQTFACSYHNDPGESWFGRFTKMAAKSRMSIFLEPLSFPAAARRRAWCFSSSATAS